MFDYKLIEAFAVVILEGGFEKAAKRLCLTQSAVSQRVKQLEDQYGCILLKRASPPEPTDQGMPLLLHYRQVSQLEADITPMAVNVSNEFSSLAIGVNADSLATWFYPSILPFLQKEQIVLDLHVDDQDVTHELLQSGKVWGCISTRKRPLQGCRVVQLGVMKYRAFASPSFAARWFPDGFTLSAAEKAPMACYNLKDDLNSRLFDLVFGRQPIKQPIFYIPSSEMYCRIVADSNCYGILPDLQSAPLEANGSIINISPAHIVNVELYWHCWNLKSATMERFQQQLMTGCHQYLV